MSRPLIPQGGNDRVYTPDALAAAIVQHFNPGGRILEPCKGTGAFVRAIDWHNFGGTAWCEIDEGRDFLALKFTDLPRGRFDWIVTNPPWSQFRAFLIHAMELAEDIVFLVTVNHFFTRARVEDMATAGFGIVEMLYVRTPPKPWPQSGFQVAAVHIKRGYAGPVKISRLNP